MENLDYQNLMQDLTSCQSSVIIVILCKGTNKRLKVSKKLETSFEQLSQESQNDLKQKMILFQGSRVTVGEMIDTAPQITQQIKGQFLYSLINDELVIGSEIKDNSFNFIERCVNIKRVYIDNVSNIVSKSRSDGFVLIQCQRVREIVRDVYKMKEGVESQTLERLIAKEINLQQYQNLIFIDSQYPSRDLTKTLLDIFDYLHVMMEADDKLIWITSYGNKKLTLNTSSEIVEIKTSQLDLLTERLVIVTGEPGSGKTSLLTRWSKLFKSKYCSKLILYFNLNNCQRFLKDHNKIEHMKDVLEFVKENISIFSFNRVFESVLETFLQSEKSTVIFLDAFDEISPLYTKQVEMILQTLLEKSKVEKIIMSSRKNMNLEGNYPVYNIKPLEREKQAVLLVENCKRLVPGGDSSAIEQFCEELHQLLTSPIQNTEMISLGIPIHIKILVEAFQNELETYLDTNILSLPKTVNILQLYEKFFDSKMSIIFNEKMDPSSAYMESVKENERLGYEKKCMISGLIVLIDDLSLVSPSISKDDKNKIIKDIKEGRIKCGIISHVVGSVIYFIHRTLAEFFTAKFLFKFHQQNEELIRKKLFERNFKVVRLFFDLMSTKDKPVLTQIILNVNSEECNSRNVTDVDIFGRNALHFAASYERSETIETLSQVNTTIVNNQDNLMKRTPINYIFELTNLTCLKIIESLIKYGAECNLKKLFSYFNYSFDDILGLSLKYDCLYVFKKILKYKGVDFHNLSQSKFYFCKNALKISVSFGSINIFKELIRSCSWSNDQLKAALYAAASYDKDDCVEYILKNEKIDLIILKTVKQKRGIKTIFKRRSKLKGETSREVGTDLLFEFLSQVRNLYSYYNFQKFEPKLKRDINLTELETEERDATRESRNDGDESGSVKILKLLLEQDVDIHTTNKDGLTLITYSCSYIHSEHTSIKVDVLDYLLDLGAPINVKDNQGNTALNYAVGISNWKILQTLLSSGGDIMTVNRDGMTLICYACNYLHFGNVIRNDDVIRLLIQQGVSVNQSDNKGNTPLHYAAYNGYVNTVQLLLEHGADVNIVNKRGQTPLLRTCWFMKFESYFRRKVLNLLIQYGASPNQVDCEGNSPLHYAVQYDTDVLDVLLDNGADVNIVNKNGRTMIHDVIWSNLKEQRTDIIELLVRNGLSVNVRIYPHGMTPLYMMLYYGRLDVVPMMLFHGADVNAVGYLEETAVEYVSKSPQFQKSGVRDSLLDLFKTYTNKPLPE